MPSTRCVDTCMHSWHRAVLHFVVEVEVWTFRSCDRWICWRAEGETEKRCQGSVKSCLNHSSRPNSAHSPQHVQYRVSLSAYTSCLGNPCPHPLPGFLISVRETIQIILGHLRTIFDQISWWEQAWRNYPHKTKITIVMIIIIYYYFSLYVSPFWRVNLAEKRHVFN